MFTKRFFTLTTASLLLAGFALAQDNQTTNNAEANCELGALESAASVYSTALDNGANPVTAGWVAVGAAATHECTTAPPEIDEVPSRK